MHPLHLGALHPVEQALTFALAFGPFVVLAIVVVVRRRADAAAEVRAAGGGSDGRSGGESEERPAGRPAED